MTSTLKQLVSRPTFVIFLVRALRPAEWVGRQIRWVASLPYILVLAVFKLATSRW